MPLRKRAVNGFAVLVTLLALPGCFTGNLWGEEVEDTELVYDEDSGQWVEETETAYEPEVDGFADLLAKIVLTPFTLVLDIVTSPFQFGFDLFDDDDDDDDNEPRRRRRPPRPANPPPPTPPVKVDDTAPPVRR